MIGIGAVLVLVTISVVITRVGAAALEATGVSADLAHFQARSAFTGVGYTTDEAETIANHPVRRRIILVLMLLGNAGIVSVIASLVLGFSDAPTSVAAQRLGVLVVGLASLWAVTSTSGFNTLLRRVIEAGLRRWTDIDVRDYVQLLDVSGDYAVRELHVDEDDWLAGCSLGELDLRAEGVVVLAVRRRNDAFLGAPAADTIIHADDAVVLYGREESLEELDDRLRGPAGDREHAHGVARQRNVETAERARDRQAEAEDEASRARGTGRRKDARRAAQRAAQARREARHHEERADRESDGMDDPGDHSRANG